MTATASAQLVSLVAAPMLTRIYTPEQYGILAMFMVLPSIIAMVAAGRYETMIQLPREDREGANVAAGGLLVSAGVSCSLALIIVGFRSPLANWCGDKQVEPWLILVPLVVFLSAIYQLVRYWSLRRGRFKEVAQATLFQALAGIGVSLTLGLFGFGIIGLILGSVCNLSGGLTRLLRTAWVHDRELIAAVSWSGTKAALRQNWPMCRTLVASLGFQGFYMRIPILFIGNTAGSAVLGQYGMAERLASLPSTVVSSALGDVFRQKAIEHLHRFGGFRQLMLQTLRITCVIALVPYALAFLLAPSAMAWVFGAKWAMAGDIIRYTLVASFFSFVITPIDKWSVILNRRRYIAVWNTYRGVFDILLTLACWKWHVGFYVFLAFLMANRIVLYFCELFFGLLWTPREQVKPGPSTQDIHLARSAIPKSLRT